MGYQKQKKVSVDRQGRPYQLCFAKQKIDFKTKEAVDAHSCFVELGGKLYLIEICEAEANENGRPDGKWVKVTKCDAAKAKANVSM